MQWWVVRDGQQSGPFEHSDLLQRAATGELLPTDPVWRVGLAAWTPAGQIPGLLVPPPLPAAPTTPPPLPSAQAQNAAPVQATPWLAARSSGPPTGSSTVQSPGIGPAGQAAAVIHPHAAVGSSDVVLPGQRAVPSSPVPPSVHWGFILLLYGVTCGIFGWIWPFVQANFVKKIDRKSDAADYFAVWVMASVAFNAMLFGAPDKVFGPDKGDLFYVALATGLSSIVLFLIGNFRMKNSLVRYYNSVENIRLYLDDGMLVFFNILYLQHHLTRIAKWKLTGQLTPQR